MGNVNGEFVMAPFAAPGLRYDLGLTPKDSTVVALVLATLAAGIWLDARGWWWSQPSVDIWVWAALTWVILQAGGAERRRLIVCVALATAGECFLGLVWGLYEYRLGNLPLFIPPGHALVYAAGSRLKRFVPSFAPAAIGAALAPFCLVGLWRGSDTQGPFWYLLMIYFLTRRRDRGFYAGMFVFALAIESYGTGLGAWRYFAREPWFGLRTVTTPPLWTGVFYCTLDALVGRITALRWPVPATARRIRDSHLTMLRPVWVYTNPDGSNGSAHEVSPRYYTMGMDGWPDRRSDPVDRRLHRDHSGGPVGLRDGREMPAEGFEARPQPD
jgi:hypothetical protein